jgi:hypothetical protein
MHSYFETVVVVDIMKVKRYFRMALASWVNTFLFPNIYRRVMFLYIKKKIKHGYYRSCMFNTSLFYKINFQGFYVLIVCRRPIFSPRSHTNLFSPYNETIMRAIERHLCSIWMSLLERMELNWVEYQIMCGIEMSCNSFSIVWMSLN